MLARKRRCGDGETGRRGDTARRRRSETSGTRKAWRLSCRLQLLEIAQCAGSCSGRCSPAPAIPRSPPQVASCRWRRSCGSPPKDCQPHCRSRFAGRGFRRAEIQCLYPTTRGCCIREWGAQAFAANRSSRERTGCLDDHTDQSGKRHRRAGSGVRRKLAEFAQERRSCTRSGGSPAKAFLRYPDQ
jgi:hypothetical protein